MNSDAKAYTPTRRHADSMEEEKEYQEAEDFDAWKLDRGESEMTHQLEFAMK